MSFQVLQPYKREREREGGADWFLLVFAFLVLCVHHCLSSNVSALYRGMFLDQWMWHFLGNRTCPFTDAGNILLYI